MNLVSHEDIWDSPTQSWNGGPPLTSYTSHQVQQNNDKQSHWYGWLLLPGRLHVTGTVLSSLQDFWKFLINATGYRRENPHGLHGDVLQDPQVLLCGAFGRWPNYGCCSGLAGRRSKEVGYWGHDLEVSTSFPSFSLFSLLPDHHDMSSFLPRCTFSMPFLPLNQPNIDWSVSQNKLVLNSL